MTLTTLNPKDPRETVAEDTESALSCIKRRLASNYRKCLRRLRIAGRHDVARELEKIAKGVTR